MKDYTIKNENEIFKLKSESQATDEIKTVDDFELDRALWLKSMGITCLTTYRKNRQKAK